MTSSRVSFTPFRVSGIDNKTSQYNMNYFPKVRVQLWHRPLCIVSGIQIHKNDGPSNRRKNKLLITTDRVFTKWTDGHDVSWISDFCPY